MAKRGNCVYIGKGDRLEVISNNPDYYYYSGKLVYIFEKGVVPSERLIRKYFHIPSPEIVPPYLLAPCKYERLVIYRTSGSYVVIPDNGSFSIRKVR